MINIILKRLLEVKNEKQRGATAVEFAIVILVFITIIFGIIEFGLLMFNQHVITNAGREGARAGIVSREIRISEDDIKDVVERYAKQHTITFSDFNWDGEDVVTVSGCEESGDILSVSIEYEYSYLFIPIGTTIIKSQTKMRCE